MNREGRFWCLDSKGYILNDADKVKINPIFNGVISKVTKAYMGCAKDKIHSIYLTGSISRGFAVPVEADLDMFAVLKDGKRDDLKEINDVSKRLLKDFPIVSDIQMEVWPWDYVFPGEDLFSIGAFIIKTHSVCMMGKDLSSNISKFKPSTAIANDDIVQMKSDIEEAIEEMNANSSHSNVQYWCKRIMKNMIRAGFSLVMVQENSHTRDLQLCVKSFSEYYPNKSKAMKRTLELVYNPTRNADELFAFLSDFGKWMISECDRWLDQYNMERLTALKIKA